MLAAALAPLNGTLLWRAFSHPGDITNTSGDQPLMQSQVFTSLDGQWPPNTVLQVRNTEHPWRCSRSLFLSFINTPVTS